LRTLAAAGVIYGLASVAGGSGFLAVFIAGLVLGDLDLPYKRQIRRFHMALASLAEIVVFVALGLTVSASQLVENNVWLDGLILAAALAFIGRPLGLAPLLVPLRLRFGEKLFIAWGGLKGAVPILLAAFALLAEVDDARRIYEIVFVVVGFSVVVQGSSIPFVAKRLGVRMRPAG
jgi:cell volume regulation protein A